MPVFAKPTYPDQAAGAGVTWKEWSESDPASLFHGGITAGENSGLVYLTLPKCACTTLKNLLYRIEYGNWSPEPDSIHRQVRQGECLVAHHDTEQLRKLIVNRSVSFTLVRDPARRIYSCFNEKVVQQGPYSFPALRTYLVRRLQFRGSSASGEYPLSRHQKNFENFLRFVDRNLKGKTRAKIDNHWRPLSTQINFFAHLLPIDVIGRVENYQEDMGGILSRAEIENYDSLLEKRINEGGSPPFSIEETMTPRAARLIADIYAEDFDRFAYKPPAV